MQNRFQYVGSKLNNFFTLQNNRKLLYSTPTKRQQGARLKFQVLKSRVFRLFSLIAIFSLVCISKIVFSAVLKKGHFVSQNILQIIFYQYCANADFKVYKRKYSFRIGQFFLRSFGGKTGAVKNLGNKKTLLFLFKETHSWKRKKSGIII